MSAIDGLISGMATSDVIRQLMALERQPVVRLQSKKTAADKAVTALQALNTKFLALADLAKKLGTAEWTTGGVTSSHLALLEAQAAPGTAPTSVAVTVKSLVATHTIKSNVYNATDAGRVSDPSSAVTISYLDGDGAARTMTVTNHTGSLQSIADAINASSTAPISATVGTDGTNFWLEMTSKTTGDLSRFDVTIPKRTVNPGSGTAQVAFTVLTKGVDAEALVGSGSFQTSVKSTSNVMEVAPGITVALKQADPNTVVTVTVAEASKPADEVQKLVDAANEILKEIKTLISYDATTKKAGVLQGNRTVRDLQSAVLNTVATAVGGMSAGEIGLELTRTGTLTFDKAKFDAAYAADPTGVASFLRNDTGNGLAQRLQSVADTATKFATGSLTQAIDARRAEIKRIDDSIALWDVRLARKEALLRKQFATLESALGAAQQQGNWLAGQISSLPTWSTE